jgi:acid phosphatase
MSLYRNLLILLVLLAGACRTATPVTPAPPAPAAAPQAVVRDTHEGLVSVLWVQASTEYRAATLGTFAAAQRMLDRALQDPAWTAAVEQQGNPAGLSPAVIVDVDETVLDNSAYQARVVRNRAGFSAESWNQWVREARAIPIPGAVEFAKYAAEHGVTMFYVTNRVAETEEPTRRNLADVGFPLTDGVDVLLTRNERPEWAGDKSSRRADIASRYRVLLVVGDNLGDFISDERIPLAERLASAERYREYWGVRWFMLPNPMYGTWEAAVLGYERNLPAQEQLRRKEQALNPAQ